MVTADLLANQSIFYNLGEALESLGLTLWDSFETHSFLGFVVLRGTKHNGERVTGRFTLTEHGNLAIFYPRSITKDRKTQLVKELYAVAPVQAISDVLDEPVTKIRRYLNPSQPKLKRTKES